MKVPAPDIGADGTRALLSTFVQLTVFLFGAFGGYLENVAPPQSPVGGVPAGYVVGFASFLAMLGFLFVKSISVVAKPDLRRIWLLFAVVAAGLYGSFGLRYQDTFAEHTYRFRDAVVVRGVLKPEYVVGNQSPVTAQRRDLDTILSQVRGDTPIASARNAFTGDSLRDAYALLTRHYMLVVMSLVLSMAFFAEVLISPATLQGSSDSNEGGPSA